MKRTLLMSVAAFALAAGSTVALSQGQGGGAAGQGAGGNTPMANPSAPSGGQDTPGAHKQNGAQERTIPEKRKSTQQSPGGKGATTGQAQEEKGAPGTKQSQEKSGQPSTTQQSQQKSGQTPATQQSQAPSTGGSKQGTAERSGGGSHVTFTAEQKTKIRQTVLTGSAPRVTSVNFDIKVGTVVPRTVRVAPLPVTIVEIEPQWRGYMYFVHNDEIIVVEPGSLRIVAVLVV